MTKTFKRDDLVCYARRFLQSVGWYTDVPIDGKVVDDTDPQFPSVHWCDRDEPVRVNAANLILKSELHLEPA
jgi:hypothetical protein